MPYWCIQPQPSLAVCDLDEADSIRNCCVLLLDTNALIPSKQEKKISFLNNATPSFLCVCTPNNYKTKKSSHETNKHLERTSKSTPTPSTLVPANIRTFSIPSDDWQDVQRPKSAPAKLFVFIAWIVEARRPHSGCRSNTRPAPIDPPTIQLQSTQRTSSDSIVRISAAYLFGRRQNRPPKINISDMAFWWKCCLLQGYTQPPMRMKDGGTYSNASCNVQNYLQSTQTDDDNQPPIKTLKHRYLSNYSETSAPNTHLHSSMHVEEGSGVVEGWRVVLTKVIFYVGLSMGKCGEINFFVAKTFLLSYKTTICRDRRSVKFEESTSSAYNIKS